MSTQLSFDTTRPLGRDDLARLVAGDIPPGSYVNLGIGQPTRVADFLPPESGVILHTENGMLGMGPQAYGDDIDPDLINAGKLPVTETPGAAYFDHADFLRHDARRAPGCLRARRFPGVISRAIWRTGTPALRTRSLRWAALWTSAMGAKDVFVLMTLFSKDGSPKLVPKCTYPLTGLACVSRVYTDYAVFVLTDHGVVARETYGIGRDDLAERLRVTFQDG